MTGNVALLKRLLLWDGRDVVARDGTDGFTMALARNDEVMLQLLFNEMDEREKREALESCVLHLVGGQDEQCSMEVLTCKRYEIATVCVQQTMDWSSS